MSELEEINQKMDSALDGIEKVQKIADRNSKRLNSLDAEQIAKLNTDVADNLQCVQDLQAKIKTQEEQNKRLETLFCSMSTNFNGKSRNEQDIEASREFSKYLRRPQYKIAKETREYIATKLVDQNYIGVDSEIRERLIQDLQVDTDPAGGYWVRPEFSNKVSTRVFETSPVRQFANNVTIGSDAWVIPIDDEEFDAGWVDERQERTKTETGKIGQEIIYAHEQYANPRATQKMLDDAGFDIEAWLQKKISSKFIRVGNTGFVTGDGSGKPRGFLSYPAWTVPGTYERGKIERLISATVGELEGDDIKKLKNALIEDYQANAIWGIKRETFGIVELLKDGDDRYLLDPNSLKTGDTQILLGKQVVFMHDMPIVANDALAVVYGDFEEGYTIVNRMGIRVLRDPFFKKPYIYFYSTMRTGGAVTNFEALKIIQINS